MLYTIQNEKLTLTVNSLGAEAWSLRDSAGSGYNYLWNGAPEIWPWRAPICFPWCGKIEDGWFEDRGIRFAADQHGFVREFEHTLTDRGENFLSFRFDWPGDGARWPWKFSFETRYSLEGSTVVTDCRAVNLDERPMPTQLGFHPGFRCPFSSGKKREDYAVRFQKPEIPGGGDLFPIPEHVFDHGNFSFSHLKSGWVQLEELETGRYLRVETEGWSYLLLWSKPGIPGFLCIEPWTGCTGPGHDPARRPGAQLLAPGKTLRGILKVSVHVF